MKKTLLCILAFCLCPAAFAASVITARLDDPKAVYLEAPAGNGDSSTALQAAIDKAAAEFRGGIVFVPEGHYSLTHTIYVWPSVRLIGYGANRPVFVLPANTPGFQKGMGVMVMFTGMAPNSPFRSAGPVPFPPPGSVPPNDKAADANQNTFYSAMSNIDFEIGDGNPAAVAVRFHVAQHAFLTHMDFQLGSGLAGIYMVGNEAEDLHFYGGRYGILTEQTSPGWQFTLIDSSFEGQREAAIREHAAGLTLIRDNFRNVPTAIDIDRGYPDQLWVKDSRFENIAGPAVVISLDHNPLTEIGFENATLSNAPVFAKLRESGRIVAGKGAIYRVKNFDYGLMVPGEGRSGSIGMKYDAVPLAAMPAILPPAIPALPASSEWVNVRTLGVKGDGTTDDTAALQRAIDTHRVLYLPSGRYVISDTLALKADTVLIGLHPILSQIDLPDQTPGYQGVGAPKAMILAPTGAADTLSGIGMLAGALNLRAVPVLWKAGEQSLIDDVRFLG
ncbi:glycosyl hydrolase family 28-related protein, partial [Bradyrhizobium sp.]|uniref:glycosyl hydrolase family 28-related protein n=1 Tax=Bradyrhizobium sp. TaxID=376 RepID=UPI003C59B559